MAVPFFIGVFLVPTFGYIIDKIGQRSYLAVSSAIFGFIVFVMFFLLPPLIPLIALGFTYSLFASVIWPSIAIVCDKQHTGLAFGLSTSLQNAGLAFFPVIVAALLTHYNNDYSVALLFFLTMMGISIFLCILLINEDKKLGGILNNVKFDEEQLKLQKEKLDNEAINYKADNESKATRLPSSEDEEKVLISREN
jgi:MFS family permease